MIKASELKSTLKGAVSVDIVRNHSALYVKATQKGGAITDLPIIYPNDNGQRFCWGIDDMGKLGSLIVLPAGCFVDFKMRRNRHHESGVDVAELWAVAYTPRPHSILVDYLVGPIFSDAFKC